MKSDYISKSIHRKKVLLNKDEMIKIDEIRKGIYESSVQEEHIHAMESIINKYTSCTFIVACTELSILFSKIKGKSNYLDLFEKQIDEVSISSFKN